MVSTGFPLCSNDFSAERTWVIPPHWLILVSSRSWSPIIRESPTDTRVDREQFCTTFIQLIPKNNKPKLLIFFFLVSLVEAGRNGRISGLKRPSLRPKKGRIGEESREMTNPNRRDGKRLDALSNPQKMVLLFEAVALTRGWEAFVCGKNWACKICWLPFPTWAFLETKPLS